MLLREVISTEHFEMETLETGRNLGKGSCVCTKIPISKMNQYIET